MGPIYEIKYAFLYGYNGTTFAVPGTSVGVHTGDLEHVTIRVDAARMMCVVLAGGSHPTATSADVCCTDFACAYCCDYCSLRHRCCVFVLLLLSL